MTGIFQNHLGGMRMAKTLIFLADGFEEVEALTVVDLVRRAGIDMKMVSITGKKQVVGAHKIVVEADVLFEDADLASADGLVLPGGMPGTRNLEAFAPLIEGLKKANAEGRLVAAICAAPLILGKNHILEGKKASCYPGFEGDLLGAKVSEDPVSVDGNAITSRGVGTAILFAGEIITYLDNKAKAEEVFSSIIYQA